MSAFLQAVLKYDPDQPRDERGRWTDTGQYVGPVPRGKVFRATVPDMPEGVFTEQRMQYPKKGPPGIGYFKAKLGGGLGHVDTLLYRDDKGKVVGVLNHFPRDLLGVERKGNFLVLVSREHRGEGIGAKLIREAGKRWNVNLAQQNYTEAGAALVNSMTAPWYSEPNNPPPPGWGVEKYDPDQPRDERGRWTVWHLTDDPNFKLDPARVPEKNTSLGMGAKAGLFVARDLEPWVNGYDYVRPFAVELRVPEELSTPDKGMYAGERFIPADRFGDVEVSRVIPLDAYVREEYRDYGWLEAWRDNKQPTRLSPSEQRYSGPDVREMTPEQQRAYIKLAQDYLRANRPWTLEKFDPDQPRAPAGTSDGGQWVRAGGALEGYSKHASLREDGVIVTSDVNDAVRALTADRHVELTQVREVATLLDKLAALAHAAEELGEKAPVYDLCKVTIKGTNLFCADALDFTRQQMPQFIGYPEPGSPSDALPRRPSGKVDVAPEFLNYLKDHDYTVTETLESASYLRASQRQLNGAKVGQMMEWLRSSSGPYEASPPLVVSADNYIIDGHHRWAALVGLDAEDGELGDLKLPVQRVNIKVVSLLVTAKQFTDHMGVKSESVHTKMRKSWLTVIKEAVWNEALHPRHPAGAPASRGGEFARQDELFSVNVIDTEYRTGKPSRRKVDVMHRPTYAGLKRLGVRELRWLKIPSNNSYFVWDSYEVVHEKMLNALVRDRRIGIDDEMELRHHLYSGPYAGVDIVEDFLKRAHLSKSWLQVITESLAKFDESQVHRAKTTPESNKGSFAPRNMGFVSPNVDENVDFQEAASRVQSHRTKLLLEADEAISEYFGTQTHESVGVGAWADGAEQSIIVDGPGDFEAFKAHMAMSGLLAEQKAIIAFTNDAKGPDSVYRLSVGNRPLKEVHSALLEAGVQFHTLRKTDHNVDVFVFAPGTEQETQNAIAKAAEHFGVDEVDFVKGYGEFLGSWDSREEGRAAYEAVLDAYESKVPGRDGGWKEFRDSWWDRFQAVRKSAESWLEEVIKYSPDQPRGKTTPESNSGSFMRLGDGSYEQTKDEFVGEYPGGKGWDSPEVQAWRGREKAWERSMLMALTEGRITQDEARARGFFPSGGGDYTVLPETLYHVTVAADRIEAEGLRTREEHGQSGIGGGTDDTISLTSDRALAEGYHTSMIDAHRFITGKTSVEDLLTEAREGTGAVRSWYSDLEETYRRESSDSIDGLPIRLYDAINGTETWAIPEDLRGDVPRLRKIMEFWGAKGEGIEPIRDGAYMQRTLDPKQVLDRKAEFINRWLFWRENTGGGPHNPTFFTNNWEKFAAMPEDNLRLLEIAPRPGAQGYYLPGESEYRVHSGAVLPVRRLLKFEESKARGTKFSWLEIVKDWDESKHPRGKTSPESNSGSFSHADDGVKDIDLSDPKPAKEFYVWRVGNPDDGLVGRNAGTLAGVLEYLDQADEELVGTAPTAVKFKVTLNTDMAWGGYENRSGDFESLSEKAARKRGIVMSPRIGRNNRGWLSFPRTGFTATPVEVVSTQDLHRQMRKSWLEKVHATPADRPDR